MANYYFIGYPIISNFNFNSIEDFEGPSKTYTDFMSYGFRREKDKIKFYTNFIACPCIYWIKYNDLWAFSFDYKLIVDFCNQNGISLTDNYENLNQINSNLSCHIKNSVKETYKYSLNYIEGWKEVYITADGNFTKINYELNLFSLEPKYNYDKLKAFLLKYKQAIKKLVDKQVFIPTITAGLDSRGLSGLWREYTNVLPGYLLYDVKNDNKNNIAQGQKELELAGYAAKAIGIKDKRFNKLDEEFVTLSGILNENSVSYENPNDPDYVYKIMQHSWGKTSYNRKLTPFMDDDYLMFAQEGEVFRVLLVCLLAKDLIHIPFLSGSYMFLEFPNGRQLWPDATIWLERVVDIFSYWGEDKVKNILKE